MKLISINSTGKYDAYFLILLYDKQTKFLSRSENFCANYTSLKNMK